jgi:hypothetical protein
MVAPMVPLIVGLLVASVALPVLGFARLLYRAQRDLNEARRQATLSGEPGYPWDDVDAMFADRVARPKATRDALIWDIVFVGLGLLAGAVASALTLPPS